MSANTTKIIVVGNEKGGSGKSTLAVSLAIGLIRRGHRIATIDLDSNQKTLTHYIVNRKMWLADRGADLFLPDHELFEEEMDSNAVNALTRMVDSRRSKYDYIVVDTPGHRSALNLSAYGHADIIITPLNDSFVDLDVLARVNPGTFKVIGVGEYARSVQEQRLGRLADTGILPRWLILRNRLSMISTRNKRLVGDALGELAAVLSFECVEGLAERLIFREFFPRGLTALDEFDAATLGTRPTMSHASARFEVENLLDVLEGNAATGEKPSRDRQAA